MEGQQGKSSASSPLVSVPATALFGHQDPKGDATKKLVTLVVVLEVGAFYLALNNQLTVVVFLLKQQLYSNQRLNVTLLLMIRDRKTEVKRRAIY